MPALQYPKEFYHLAPISGRLFNDSGTGDIDIDRLANGKPCFVELGLIREKKQKSLILCDWTATSWSSEKIAQVQATLQELMGAGFHIYLWQAGKVVQLSVDTVSYLNQFDTRKAIEPIFQEELITAAIEQCKLTKDSIHCLDDYWLSDITSERHRSTRKLFISDYLAQTEKHRKVIIEILKQANPPLNEIILDEFSTKSHEDLEPLYIVFAEQMRSITKPRYYKKIVINSDRMIQDLAEGRTIEFYGIRLMQQHMKYVEYFYFYHPFNLKPDTAEAIIYFVNDAPNLRALSMDFNYDIKFDISVVLKPEALSNLEKLHLSTNMEISNLQTILNTAGKLKELWLLNYDDMESPISLNEYGLLQLEELNLFQSNMLPYNIQLILHRATKLKKLTLSNAEALVSFLSTEDSPLSELEELDLSLTELTVSELRIILVKLPKLKKLNLTSIATSLYNLSFLQEQLPLELEELDLSETEISVNDLCLLLNKTPKLKKLTLGFYDLIQKSFELDDTKLNYLEELNLSPLFNYDREASGDYDFLKGVSHSIAEVIKAVAPNLRRVIIVENPSETSRVLTPIVDALASSVPADPIFNPNDLLTTNPQSLTPFTYKNIGTKNQTMIIERLSQYLTLTKQHEAVNTRLHIEKMQVGICQALSLYFLSMDEAAWTVLIDQVETWNGRISTLNDDELLLATLEDLYNTVITNQFSRHAAEGVQKQYLGEALGSALVNLTFGEGYLIVNPDHALAVRKKSETEWLLYDPNFVAGYKTLPSLQDTIDVIHYSLGPVVSVRTNQFMAPLIHNQEQFIENGGLLALTQATNYIAMLTQLKASNHFSKDVLNALLHRDIDGVPAWLRGLNHPSLEVQTYTACLLEQFKALNLDETLVLLNKSMEALSGYRKFELITTLIQSTLLNPLKDELVAISRVAMRGKLGEQAEAELKPWLKQIPDTPSTREYCKELVSGTIKKRLVEFNNQHDIQGMQLALQLYCQRRGLPIFHVNIPDDLNCSAPYVDHNGILRAPPTGPLHRFLSSQISSDHFILVVNYSQFTADDIVRFNALLDQTPFADNFPLPEGACIIGLSNTQKAGCYQGRDFYSRFDKIDTTPLSNVQLQAYLPELRVVLFDSSAQPYVINLYQAHDWKARLLGRWILNGNHLTYKEGALKAAIESGLPIELRNAPWNDEQFQYFLNHARVSERIQTGSGVLRLPKKTVFIQGESPPLSLPEGFSIQMGLSFEPFAVILNPSCFAAFFNRYTCNNQTKQLTQQLGIIELVANNSLHINLIRDLDVYAWEMLLDECQRFKVLLHIHCGPGVSLPDTLKPEGFIITKFPMPIAGRPTSDASTQLICSSDIDAIITSLHTPDDSLVIDVTECHTSDLFGRTHGAPNKEHTTFEFNQSESLLLNALYLGRTVILKGHFSNELVDALTPHLLLRYLIQTAPGILILVTNNAKTFGYLPHYAYEISAAGKARYLGLPEAQEGISLAELRSQQNYLRASPKGCVNEARIGLLDLTDADPIFHPLDASTSIADAKAYRDAQVKQVKTRLLYAPYLLLTGKSGVGKSTFVLEELSQEGVELFVGEERLLDWAMSKKDGLIILFLDEANLKPCHWSQFEGLYNKTPAILIDGAYYTLSSNHKVIFAGNPLSYGDRYLASFFVRHGNALLFKPMPPAVIYEKILKPVFHNTDLDPEQYSKAIIAVYQFLCSCSSKDVLVSPRELQMMALLITDYYNRHHEFTATALMAQHIIYNIASSLVPLTNRLDFDRKFKPLTSLTGTSAIISEHFLITPSRQPVAQQLVSLLLLRESRQKTGLNEAQSYGGLGGIIIEGEPGVGKSELVTAILLALGYEEVRGALEIIPDKPFYRMPVSMSLSQKKTLLLKAFEQGAVVVIDEINSSPMMEALLNALLMGKNEQGVRPETLKPGFMIIGTQNPVTMAGRLALSTALARRLMTMVLPEYPREEMIAILFKKGLHQEPASLIIDAFEKNRALAKSQHLSPEPTFRHLLKWVDTKLRASIHAAEPGGVSSTSGQELSNRTSASFFKTVETLPKLYEVMTRFSSFSY